MKQKFRKINTPLIGAIAGDIIGSVYEFDNVKTINFPLFVENSTYTDDTVMSIAVADCLLNKKNYTATLQEYGRKYPGRGYGGRFSQWINEEHPQPYNSWGNGSAMRVSAVGCLLNDLDSVLAEAKRSAECTHNHPEGIKGAQAVAAAVFLARRRKTKAEIKSYIESAFKYDLSRTLDDIRPGYRFDVSCQGSAPEGVIAFLESYDFESAVRFAVSIGGDSDTIACITGGIALAYYKEIPDAIAEPVWEIVPEEFKEIIMSLNEIH